MSGDDKNMSIRSLIREGYCCSQIILILALRLRAEENEAMVRAASGLCLGMHSGLTCGTLAAAAQALALFDPKNAATQMIPQLMEWYEEAYGGRYGSANCLDITGGSMRVDRCLDILGGTWNEVKRLLAEFGFEVGAGA